MKNNDFDEANQISMSGFQPDGQDERDYISAIWSQLVATAEKHGGSEDMLSVVTVKPGYKFSGNYVSLKLGSMVVFRIKLHGSSQYLSFPNIFKDLVSSDIPQKSVTSQKKYILVTVDKSHPIEGYTELVLKILGESLNRYPAEWSCCSRFEQCSNARVCINPDKNIALACNYRKILNSGRVFYGENRNI